MRIYLFTYKTARGETIRIVTIEAETLVHAYRVFHRIRPTAREVRPFREVGAVTMAAALALATETPDA